MTKEQKEKIANVYNTLATMIPVPSEEFSAKHAFCLHSLRVLLEEDGDEKQDE